MRNTYAIIGAGGCGISIIPVLKDNLKNETDYEIIFVGPFKPRFKLPKNCKFIHSIVKPTQCAEIGFRAAKGYFLFGTLGDDLISKKKTDQKFNHVHCAPTYSMHAVMWPGIVMSHTRTDVDVNSVHVMV